MGVGSRVHQRTQRRPSICTHRNWPVLRMPVQVPERQRARELAPRKLRLVKRAPRQLELAVQRKLGIDAALGIAEHKKYPV